MGWFFLLLAGVFEIGFTTFLKLSNNFTVWRYSIAFALCAMLSFFLLNKSISYNVPLGTAYAVWTGIGAAGTTVIGIVFFQEPSDFWRIFFVVTLVASIIGLKCFSTS